MKLSRAKSTLPVLASVLLYVGSPPSAHAGDASGAKTFSGILSESVMPMITSAINLIVIITFLVFVWGVLRFIQGAGDDKRRTEERKFLMWGTIALFLMVSVWGVVKIVHTLFFGSS